MLYQSLLSATAALFTFSSASPISTRSPPSGPQKNWATPFYLVTSSSASDPYPSSDYSRQGVTALTIFNTKIQDHTYLLSQVERGYTTPLSQFTIVNGVLNATALTPDGLSESIYSSVPVPTIGSSEDFEFQFEQGTISSGNLGIVESHFPSLLIGADGLTDNWVVCPELGEEVVLYHDPAHGALDAACSQVYMHAVYDLPY